MKIYQIINDNLSVENYLDDFTKHSKTNYQVKTKCKDDKMGELEKPKKNTIVVENEEEKEELVIEKPKKTNQTKKKKDSDGTRKRCPNGTKRNKDGDCV